MIRLQRLWPLAALSLLLACDGGKADTKKGDAKKADAKKADAKKADAKKDDAKKGDAKAGDKKDGATADAKADGGDAPKAGEKHFDVTQDKSGILARSAAVLDASEKIDSENLHEISHHAEKLPSYEAVCKHEAGVKGEGFDEAACVTAMEHHMVQLGPELYKQLADCMLAAKTGEEVDACEAAEAEAEKLLHEKPHGDGLTKEVCDELFTHFEKLAMEDAAEHAEIVKEVLEEVRPDVLVTCMEQGTQAEIDCSMKAEKMAELKECASKLL